MKLILLWLVCHVFPTVTRSSWVALAFTLLTNFLIYHHCGAREDGVGSGDFILQWTLDTFKYHRPPLVKFLLRVSTVKLLTVSSKS